MINLLILLFVLLLFYYFYFLFSILRGLSYLNSTSIKAPLPVFVSIIIPFRNEEKNIIKNLKSLESQNYPKEKYEIIYVDDSSTDNSLKILMNNIKNENIKVLPLACNCNDTASKKRAVKFGIENSNGEVIVTSDADCSYGKDWLISLLSAFEEDTGFVSGPVEYSNESNIFSQIQSLEFTGLILAGAGLIGINKPVISNGANIAYRKSIYIQLNGFEDQMHISSGDDGLLMQKIHESKKSKIKFCLNQGAIVKTKPLDTVTDFYNQRKRWASKNIFYSRKIQLELVLIFLFYTGLLLQLVFSFSLSYFFLLTFSASLIFKFLFEYLILKRGKDILFPKLQLKYFFITEIFQVPYIVISSLAGLFGNFIWKGRKLKR